MSIWETIARSGQSGASGRRLRCGSGDAQHSSSQVDGGSVRAPRRGVAPAACSTLLVSDELKCTDRRKRCTVPAATHLRPILHLRTALAGMRCPRSRRCSSPGASCLAPYALCQTAESMEARKGITSWHWHWLCATVQGQVFEERSALSQRSAGRPTASHRPQAGAFPREFG
eukprot:3899484-Prymnesium_polylepis.1